MTLSNETIELIEKKAIELGWKFKNENIVSNFANVSAESMKAALTDPAILASVKGEEWVDVNDRLPELGERVLVSLETGWVELIGILYENGWTCFYSDGQKMAEVNQVTHWQPLPTPPKTK